MALAVRFGSGLAVVATIASVLCSTILPATALDTTSPAAPAGVTITPSQKDLIISPGLLTAHTDIQLRNNSGSSLTATLRLLDFKTLNETGGLLFTQAGVPSDKYGLANYLALPNGPTVTIPNGQTITIPVTVHNRADLAPGGHYGAVVATFGTDGAASSGQARFKQELVSLLLVTKRGGERYGLRLSSLLADSSRVMGLPPTASLKIRSTGNVHIVPRGYITVQDKQGQVLAKGIINQQSDTVLPDITKLFTVPLSPLTVHQSGMPYKLTAYYRYDEQSHFQSQSVVLMSTGIPILYVLGAVIGTLIVACGAWYYHHNTHQNRRIR